MKSARKLPFKKIEGEQKETRKRMSPSETIQYHIV